MPQEPYKYDMVVESCIALRKSLDPQDYYINDICCDSCGKILKTKYIKTIIYNRTLGLPKTKFHDGVNLCSTCHNILTLACPLIKLKGYKSVMLLDESGFNVVTNMIEAFLRGGNDDMVR